MQTQAAIDPSDWATLWQSELAARAVDREWHEQLAALAEGWAAAARSRHDAAARGSGADAPAGTAAVGAAFDAGGGELEQLRRRVAELEQRLLAGR